MRCLVVVTGMNTGGAEVLLRNLCPYFDRHFDELQLVSLLPLGPEASKVKSTGVEVISLEITSALSIPLGIARLCTLLLRYKPDLIYGWMYHGALFSMIAKLIRPRAGIIWSMHHSLSGWRDEKYSLRVLVKILALLSGRVRAVVFCSRQGLEDHCRIGFSELTASVIFNGVSLGQWETNSVDRLSSREQYGVRAGELVVANVGRYSPMKDHLNFIQGVRIAADHQAVRMYCLMAGGGVDTHNQTITEALISSENVRFRLLGEIDGVKRLLSASDVLVVSSSHGEAMPMIILEAMAAGVFCISTDVGDCRMLLGDHGFTVPIKNPIAIATALRDFSRLSETRKAELKKTARSFVSEKFSLQVTAEKYVAESGNRAILR